MPIRIDPAKPPFPPEIQSTFDRLMPADVPPLTLFTVLATDNRLFSKFMAGGLLDKGNLTLRQREIVIDRVTAQCGSEYEWGVHIAFFAKTVSFSKAQIYSFVHGDAADPCWRDKKESLLIQTCDALHSGCRIDDGLWRKLTAHFTTPALLEIIMLAGFYRTVSYLTNATLLPLESFAATFPPTR